MGFLDRFVDTEKTSKMEVKSPRDIYYGILKNTSGTAYTRKMDVDIFYTVYGFKGVTEGVGCSTLVANVAQAIADMGLTVCVIDTSILSPVQDILLKTDVEYDVSNTYDKNEADKRLDWFDMPYEKKSVLHLSKINQNISVLSFKGKKHTIIDFLSTNDSETLVEMALAELHTKFDIILVDICHEPSAVATACLQQSQKIIQVWNDAPTVLGNLERFITNSVTLACPMDKMSNVVYSKVQRDALGSLDNVLKEYKFKKIGINYFSEEVALQAVIGNNLFQLPSNDKNVIAYTDCVIDVACMILNLTADREETKAAEAQNKKNKGIIKTEDILNGRVDGTATKKLRDRERKINQDLGITPIKTLDEADASLNDEGFVDAYKDEGFITSLDEFTQESSESDVSIADDPDFSMVDLEQDTETIANDGSANEDIEFEPLPDEEETPTEFEATEDDAEFSVGDFEPTNEEEFEADTSETAPSDIDSGTIVNPALDGDDSNESISTDTGSDDDFEEPISDASAEEDEFVDSDFEEAPSDEFIEEEPTSDAEPMETIDVPEEFFEEQEEPVSAEDFESAPTEEYTGEINEVQYDGSESAVNSEEIQQIMDSDDDEEFFEEGDFEDTTSEEPISDDEFSADADASQFEEGEATADDFETPTSESLEERDVEEVPISEELSEAETDTFDEITELVEETQEDGVSDESTDLGSDEFFDMDDDFEAAPVTDEADNEEFSIDNETAEPILDQSIPADDTETPISEQGAAIFEPTESDTEFADDFEESQESDNDFTADGNAEASNDDDFASDDEFLDDDDEFFLDDDENLKALDNYVKSQNTEYNS